MASTRYSFTSEESEAIRGALMCYCQMMEDGEDTHEIIIKELDGPLGTAIKKFDKKIALPIRRNKP